MKNTLIILVLSFLFGFGICSTSVAVQEKLTFEWEQKITDDLKGWKFFHTTDNTLKEWNQLFTVNYSNEFESGSVITHSTDYVLFSVDGEEVVHHFYAVAENVNGDISSPSNIVNVTVGTEDQDTVVEEPEDQNSEHEYEHKEPEDQQDTVTEDQDTVVEEPEPNLELEDNTYDATVLYRQQESIFSDSADIIALIFNAKKQPISSNEQIFLSQIENETNLLYILTHGLPDEGLMITKDKRVAWHRIAKHVQSDILIVDTCFSGQILQQTDWLKKPSLIITSTARDNYSYNPAIVDDYRVSLLSIAMYLYLSDQQTLDTVSDYLGVDLSGHNNKMSSVFGINYILNKIKYLHLKLYATLVVKENFVTPLRNVEDKYGIQFKGFSAIRYQLN